MPLLEWALKNGSRSRWTPGEGGRLIPAILKTAGNRTRKRRRKEKLSTQVQMTKCKIDGKLIEMSAGACFNKRILMILARNLHT